MPHVDMSERTFQMMLGVRDGLERRVRKRLTWDIVVRLVLRVFETHGSAALPSVDELYQYYGDQGRRVR